MHNDGKYITHPNKIHWSNSTDSRFAIYNIIHTLKAFSVSKRGCTPSGWQIINDTKVSASVGSDVFTIQPRH